MNRIPSHERRHRPDVPRTAVAPPRRSYPVPRQLAEWLAPDELAMRLRAYGLDVAGDLAEQMASARTYPMLRPCPRWCLADWSTHDRRSIYLRLRGQDDRGGVVELAVSAWRRI